MGLIINEILVGKKKHAHINTLATVSYHLFYSIFNQM